MSPFCKQSRRCIRNQTYSQRSCACVLIPPRVDAMQTMPYRLDESTGLIDYDALEATATLYRPKACTLPSADVL